MMDITHRWNISFKPMIVGYVLSLILIFAAYFLIQMRLFPMWTLMLLVATLASAQALIQLILFLNLGIERKPRWNMMMFLFMLIVMIVVIGGSMWIMYNLNYHMMPKM